jgi:hypothetical protein
VLFDLKHRGDDDQEYYILKKNEEFITLLDDHLVAVTNILANRYVTKIRK